MRSIVIRGLVLSVVTVGSLFAVGPAVQAAAPTQAAAPRPDVEVVIDDRAREGQYHTVEGSFRLRCRAGLAASEVWVSFTQDFTSPEQNATSVPCDGAWHRQQFRSYEGFEPGLIVVHVRAVMVNASTGAPRSEATFSKEIFVRPGAVIVLPGTAELRPNHAIRFQVQARCDTPWVPQGLYVAASQFNGRTYASVYLDVPCDGAFHHRTVLLKATGIQFARGWIIIDSFLHTLDPVNFDPAPSTAANRGARVDLSPRARPPGPTHGGPMKRVSRRWSVSRRRAGGEPRRRPVECRCRAADRRDPRRRPRLRGPVRRVHRLGPAALQDGPDRLVGPPELHAGRSHLTGGECHPGAVRRHVASAVVHQLPGQLRRPRAGARTDGARRHRHRSGARRGDVDA